MPIGHGQAGAIVEILQIQPEAAVLLQIDKFLEDQIGVSRLAVRGKSHDFVFAGIDFEAGVIGEGGVEQAKGIGKMDLLQHGQLMALADAQAGGRPFADPIDGEDSGLLERGGEEGAARVALMVLGEQEPTFKTILGLGFLQFLAKQAFLEQIFSFIQTGMAVRKERKTRGAKARYVSSSRSNFKKGLS